MPGIRWRNLLGIYNLAHYDTDKNGVYKHTLKNSVAGDFFLYRTTNIARKHDAWIVSFIFCYVVNYSPPFISILCWFYNKYTFSVRK